MAAQLLSEFQHARITLHRSSPTFGRRIIEMVSAGVTNLFVQAFQTFVGPQQELRTFGDEVFTRLKAAGYR